MATTTLVAREGGPQLHEFLLYFLRLGTYGFGGPIALAGYMQKDLVEERKWVSAVIDARRSDSLDRLRTLAPNGIDAALVLAGGKSAEECLRFVRAHGRVAHPNGVEPAPRHRRNIRVRAYDAEAGPKQFAQLERAILEAKLRVPIAAVCSLARAAAAHARLERGHVLGKIVLQVRRKT
jgi:NADPH2:quinone reductase